MGVCDPPIGADPMGMTLDPMGMTLDPMGMTFDPQGRDPLTL